MAFFTREILNLAIPSLWLLGIKATFGQVHKTIRKVQQKIDIDGTMGDAASRTTLWKVNFRRRLMESTN